MSMLCSFRIAPSCNRFIDTECLKLQFSKWRRTPEAGGQLEEVPRAIRVRMFDIIERLRKWPAVSGAKPLRGDLQGSFRIRTGEYRVIFEVSADGERVTITKIG